MNTTELVFSLAVVTLALAVAFAGWQMLRVRSAKRHNEHSALSAHPGAKPSAPLNKTMDGRK